ncbi:unnamed protein product [Camellia sinensis]
MRTVRNYFGTEKQHISFQGVGRTLGGSTTPEAPEPTVDTPLNAAPTPSMGLVVDEKVCSQPQFNSLTFCGPMASSEDGGSDSEFWSPRRQPCLPWLRAGPGTRMITHFNYHHTTGHIRAFIDASRPGDNRAYQLQAVGFPPKPLTDPTQTIEQAGLANSIVIQKSPLHK